MTGEQSQHHELLKRLDAQNVLLAAIATHLSGIEYLMSSRVEPVDKYCYYTMPGRAFKTNLDHPEATEEIGGTH